MHFYCEKCKKEYPMDTLAYKCICGGLFRLFKHSDEVVPTKVSLGEVRTPLLPIHVEKIDFLLKLEHLQPTGSFKDRGAFMLINELKNLGIKEIVEDSAGNAAAAIAAYAAAAGIDCLIYLPEKTSPAKIRQIESTGAMIKKVRGDRDKTAQLVQKAAKERYYASHVYNPLFFEGMKSMAQEIYEQLGQQVPEYIFMPVGNGTMLLGLYYGFAEIGRLPKLVAVQSCTCQPLCRALHKNVDKDSGETIAESIRVGNPARLDEMLQAIKNSRGDAVSVTDEEIMEAAKILGTNGIYTEISSAAALAGAKKFFKDGKPDNYKVVIPLTGHGLK